MVSGTRNQQQNLLTVAAALFATVVVSSNTTTSSELLEMLVCGVGAGVVVADDEGPPSIAASFRSYPINNYCPLQYPTNLLPLLNPRIQRLPLNPTILRNVVTNSGLLMNRQTVLHTLLIYPKRTSLLFFAAGPKNSRNNLIHMVVLKTFLLPCSREIRRRRLELLDHIRERVRESGKAFPLKPEGIHPRKRREQTGEGLSPLRSSGEFPTIE